MFGCCISPGCGGCDIAREIMPEAGSLRRFVLLAGLGMTGTIGPVIGTIGLNLRILQAFWPLLVFTSRRLFIGGADLSKWFRIDLALEGRRNRGGVGVFTEVEVVVAIADVHDRDGLLRTYTRHLSRMTPIPSGEYLPGVPYRSPCQMPYGHEREPYGDTDER